MTFDVAMWSDVCGDRRGWKFGGDVMGERRVWKFAGDVMGERRRRWEFKG